MTFIRHAAAAAACTLLALAAQAQQVYRIVGPDGRVTFSDRPPAAGAEAAPVGAGAQGSGGSEALPYQLRQIAARFPVTLYTGSDCAPCDSARNLLVSRGVPFTERTVGSNEDIEALRRLSGESSLPFGTIGGQQLKGFSDSEWSQYLDAAGYPRQSQLPPGYRRPPATPLVAVQARPAVPEAESAPAAPAARPAAPATPPTGRTPANPAGIVF
ncbi:glutaredoxin family protein [Alicycliphilus denitrificans]|uniref:Glutaredoxin n=1 Tax=Alicycliphilus denitrificans (strain DSM 14773 / CIP 107495 / K601) TaxID=596154 RepID=F4GCB5_ALIDK|nr:glutaredoxin family protein [Alicycliphilus denitrificans]ADU99957.1 glutaredoxin [Alicycliphilus denitrificans BC]AEB84774.1 glutaredoxin [Alicycliphilus denitrificans K601]GAO23414.1 glutaredoxin [Alicycliphilus sp. B1]